MQKTNIFDENIIYIYNLNIRIHKVDKDRPWGGFFVIEEDDAQKFIEMFFPEINEEDLLPGAKLSPKILLVQPGKKLSWQYHHRRAEIWKLIKGKAALSRSDSDKEAEMNELKIGDIVKLKQGERHRLIGLDEWGIVAEIWMHTQPTHPSDEDDIVRLQDDFGR